MKKNAFYNCVKENYDLIIRLNTLKQEERNMDNLAFRFLVFSLRDTYGQLEKLYGIIKFKEDIQEYEFFNNMVNLISNMVGKTFIRYHYLYCKASYL